MPAGKNRIQVTLPPWPPGRDKSPSARNAAAHRVQDGSGCKGTGRFRARTPHYPLAAGKQAMRAHISDRFPSSRRKSVSVVWKGPALPRQQPPTVQMLFRILSSNYIAHALSVRRAHGADGLNEGCPKNTGRRPIYTAFRNAPQTHILYWNRSTERMPSRRARAGSIYKVRACIIRRDSYIGELQ